MDISSRTAVVIGDVILDRTTHVQVTGVSPESENVLVAQKLRESSNLGGAGNVAANLTSLGINTLLLGAVGVVGEAGACLRALLFHFNQSQHGRRHLAWRLADVLGAHHSVKHRMVSSSGQLLRIDDEAVGGVSLAAGIWDSDSVLRGELTAWLEYSNVLPLLVNYNKGFFSDARVLGYLENCPLILVDPGKRGDEWHRFARSNSFFKANVRQCLDFAAHSGFTQQAPSVEDGASCARFTQWFRDVLICANVSFQYFCVTFGVNGAGLFSSDRAVSPVILPADTVKLADPCGAGDTFMAALAASLIQQNVDAYVFSHAVRAVTFAVKAAGLVVRKPGVATVTMKEVSGESGI